MGELVQLYVFDMSESSHASSNRSSCSSGVAGIALVYHTSIVAFGKEYSFNSREGITVTPLNRVVGRPDKTHVLGRTRKTMYEFEKFVEDLSDTFQARNYELLLRNCQEFSIKLCEFLGVEGLPEYIRKIPQLARSSFGSETGLKATGGSLGAAVGIAAVAGLGFLLYKGLSKNNNNKN